MPEEKPAVIVDAPIVRREFGYHKGPVNLTFSLRIDVRDEIDAFVELLDKASEELKLLSSGIK